MPQETAIPLLVIYSREMCMCTRSVRMFIAAWFEIVKIGNDEMSMQYI